MIVYIKSSDTERRLFLKPEFYGKWVLKEKVPIKDVKIDRSLFAWDNPVYPEQVDFLVENFNQEFWTPIIVNPEIYLLDGQHRLEVAKRLGLKYIDILIEQDEEVILKRMNTHHQEKSHEISDFIL